ncbi:MAG: hypothetical protein ACTSYB_10940 [Candidatus Helarchaeota archaeon]
MSILKQFLTQIIRMIFPQIGILNLGENTITDLSGFTTQKIAGRMIAA